MRKNTKSQARRERKIKRFVDDSMGLPVVLIDSVIESSFDGEKGIVVPNLKGLEAAMAVARVTIPDKLSGREISFLRKAIGLKAVELASFLDMVPETLSRWENGREAITTNPERILRMRVLRALKDKAPGVSARVDDVLEMKLLAVRASLMPITLIFERIVMLVEDTPQSAWVFQGVEQANMIEKTSKNVA